MAANVLEADQPGRGVEGGRREEVARPLEARATPDHRWLQIYLLNNTALGGERTLSISQARNRRLKEAQRAGVGGAVWYGGEIMALEPSKARVA